MPGRHRSPPSGPFGPRSAGSLSGRGRPAWLTLSAVRRTLAAVAVGAAALAVVTAGTEDGPASRPASGASPPAQQVVVEAAPVPSRAAPLSVDLPSIGAQSRLVELGVDGAGALVPPSDFALAGWFTGGPVPGEVGPAVIAGHVDSRDGPAVFYRLEELTPGDEVSVTRADGSVAQFAVTRVEQYPKAAFDTADVYGPTAHPELRLITCGGVFDHTRRSYTHNIVVFARLVG